MSRAIRRVSVAVGVTVLAVFTMAGTAAARQPAVRACVGSTFSTDVQAATASGQPAGQNVRSFAQDPFSPPGLGDGLQALQAGVVPDGVVPNTCN